MLDTISTKSEPIIGGLSASQVIDCRDEQSLKAVPSINVTLYGIVILVKEEHPSKRLDSNACVFCERINVLRDEHS